MAIHSFGFQNATITKLYAVDSSDSDTYGSPDLTSPTVTTARVWFEDTTTEQRQVDGDSYDESAIVTGPLLEGIKEGDVIEITLDSIGAEASENVNNWRIEKRDIPRGLPSVNSRIRQMELTVSIQT